MLSSSSSTFHCVIFFEDILLMSKSLFFFTRYMYHLHVFLCFFRSRLLNMLDPVSRCSAINYHTDNMILNQLSTIRDTFLSDHVPSYLLLSRQQILPQQFAVYFCITPGATQGYLRTSECNKTAIEVHYYFFCFLFYISRDLGLHYKNRYIAAPDRF